MNKIKIVQNYLADQLGYPPYYSMKKDYILEYSWEHWAAEEIVTRLRTLNHISPIRVIRGFNVEMNDYIHKAKEKKSNRAEILFTTALAVGKDVEGLLNAMEKEE